MGDLVTIGSVFEPSCLFPVACDAYVIGAR